VERGSHQELIAKNGAYARLHSMQFKEHRKGDQPIAATEALHSDIA